MTQRFATVFLFVLVAASLANGQILTHGPVVGGVTDTSANVFVRTDQAGDVVLRYGTDPALATYSETPSATTEEANDFTKIIPISDLVAETTYYLNVVVNGVQHLAEPPYPSFKSFAPAGVARNFKFVVLADFTSSSKLTRETATFANASAMQPDFVFLGGDFDHREPKIIEDKREMFKELYDRTTPFMSNFVPLILEKTSIIRQWDDHDSGANNIDRTYADWALTQQAFQEYVPLYPLPSVSPGIWQKFSYAQLDGFVLDGRSQRDPGRDADGPDKSMLDGNNLGATGQLQWLEDGLLASTARWKVIFTSVVTNPTTKPDDGWSAYQNEWNILKTFINSNNITGVVFIAGDLHLGAIDRGVASGFPEMCVAAANSEKSHVRCSTAKEGDWSEGYFEDPCAGFGLVSVSTDPDQLILQAVDELGMIRIAYSLPDTALVPPSIVTQPRNRSARVGARARFNVSATGSTPLTYQWKKNDIDIAGATQTTYITPPLTTADNGAIFNVVVSNAAGTATSNSVTVTVRTPSQAGNEVYSGSGTNYTNSGTLNGRTYFYSAFVVDEVPNYAAPGHASAMLP